MNNNQEPTESEGVAAAGGPNLEISRGEHGEPTCMPGKVEGYEADELSSSDSLNLLLERQRERQLNHPLHQNHIKAAHVQPGGRKVKETHKISLEYDPISKRKVLNTYEIIRELGSGQHGKVKLALDLVTKQHVAIKIVDRHGKKKSSWKLKKTPVREESEKIRREIAIMKKCDHEHVVKLIEVLDDMKSRKIYLVLEYCSKGEVKWCPGDQLEAAARGPPLLTFQRTREILRGVVLGLEYLHYQGIIHRDIKPANLLLSEHDIVKISDFGVSLASSNSGTPSSRSSSSSSVKGVLGAEGPDDLELAKTAGTPAFFAPEICLGSDAYEKLNIDRQSNPCSGSLISYMIDIWALGVTLYCLLFGKLPFIAEYEMELFEKIVNDPLEFPRLEFMQSNGVSMISCKEEYLSAQDLLNKLLEKNPMQRINIVDIKAHPFVCWDFDHVDGLSGQRISMRQAEKQKFLRHQDEEYKQISVSHDEVDNAVNGIGKGLKKSQIDTLFDSGVVKNKPLLNPTSVIDACALLKKPKTKDLKDRHSPTVFDSIRRETFSPTDIDSLNFILSEGSIANSKDFLPGQPSTPSPLHQPPIQAELSARELFQRELQKFDNDRDPNSIVSLPVNSSFASLDSFYIDNYAVNDTNVEAEFTPSFSTNDQRISSSYQQFTSSNLPHKGASALLSPFSNMNVSGTPKAQDKILASPPPLSINTLQLDSKRNGRIPRVSSILSPQSTTTRSSSSAELSPAAFASRFRMTPTAAIASSESAIRLDNRSQKSELATPRLSIGTNGTSQTILAKRYDSSRSLASQVTKSTPLKQGNPPLTKKIIFQELHGSDEEKDSITTDSAAYMSTESAGEYSYDGTKSDTESLPFEFGIDSEHGSEISLRNVPAVGGIDSFCQPETLSASSASTASDADDDELVFPPRHVGRSRRFSSSADNSSSRALGVSQPAISEEATDIAPASISGQLKASDSLSTLTQINSARTVNTPSGDGVNSVRLNTDPSYVLPVSQDVEDSIDVPAEVLHMIPELHKQDRGNMDPVTQTGGVLTNSWLLPHTAAQATTQEAHVDQVLITSSQDHSHHLSSRDLLQSVLSSSDTSRRSSLHGGTSVHSPTSTSAAQDESRLINAAKKLARIRKTDDSSGLTMSFRRQSLAPEFRHKEAHSKSRSCSISLGQLDKRNNDTLGSPYN
ncbi:FACL053Cp [Eremothecium gossypii FDAG1]|nr:FACL053Cp [Eremothecium gossypii FDAG1]